MPPEPHSGLLREQVGPFTHVCIDCGALGVAGGYHDHGNGSAGDTMPLAALPEMVRQMHSAERDRDDLMEELKELEDQRDAAAIMRAAFTPHEPAVNSGYGPVPVQTPTTTPECERFRAALQDISEQDYRGNRPWSATRAHQALHPETGT